MCGIIISDDYGNKYIVNMEQMQRNFLKCIIIQIIG